MTRTDCACKIAHIFVISDTGDAAHAAEQSPTVICRQSRMAVRRGLAETAGTRTNSERSMFGNAGFGPIDIQFLATPMTILILNASGREARYVARQEARRRREMPVAQDGALELSQHKAAWRSGEASCG